jgi:hypothetical protein
MGDGADVCLAGTISQIGRGSDFAIKVDQVLKAERLRDPVDLRKLGRLPS